MLAMVVLALLPAACAGAATSAPADATRAAESPGVSRIAMGDRRPAPPLSGTTLKGAHLSLADVAGSVVVVNVWASWCEPCRTESPALARMARQLASQKVGFVGINELDSTGPATTFLAAAGVTYPQLVDSDGALLRRLPLLPQKGIPSTLILDRHHRMAARVIGPVTGAEIQTLVSELLQEH